MSAGSLLDGVRTRYCACADVLNPCFFVLGEQTEFSLTHCREGGEGRGGRVGGRGVGHHYLKRIVRFRHGEILKVD